MTVPLPGRPAPEPDEPAVDPSRTPSRPGQLPLRSVPAAGARPAPLPGKPGAGAGGPPPGSALERLMARRAAMDAATGAAPRAPLGVRGTGTAPGPAASPTVPARPTWRDRVEPTAPRPSTPTPRPTAGSLRPASAPRTQPATGAWPPPIAPVDEPGYAKLSADVKSLLGFDLSQYKAPQVWRRVNAFASTHACADAAELIERCRRDPALCDAFRDMITINVSEFFRNPESWDVLRDAWLAPLLRRQSAVRIWSAGCSIGFEPYTLAMLCRELAPAAAVRIVGTDLDITALDRARQARYTEQQMLGVSAARRSRFFDQAGGDWVVRPELRSLITFRRHDLLRDTYESACDLIVCRNVVIYFTEAAKSEIFRRFAASLNTGGVLFIGATESIHDARSVGLIPNGVSFYTRAAT